MAVDDDDIFFDPVWIVPCITHTRPANSKDNIADQESHSLSTSLVSYITDANMAVSLAQKKALQEVKISTSLAVFIAAALWKELVSWFH